MADRYHNWRPFALPSFLQLICSYQFLSIPIGTAGGGAHCLNRSYPFNPATEPHAHP